jgi:nuclear pore complex protein Nup188
VQHSKVVLGEQASVGTLLELAGSAIDILSLLVSRPAGQALAPRSAITARALDRPLDVSEAARTLRRTLEAILFYGATQLGLWLVRPDGLEGVDAEMDEGEGARGRLDERRRRGMVDEMAAELRGAIEKARGVMAKGVAERDKGPDVLEVVVRFLNERVTTAGTA